MANDRPATQTKDRLMTQALTAADFKTWTTAGLVIAVARFAAGQMSAPVAKANAQLAATELNIRVPVPRAAEDDRP